MSRSVRSTECTTSTCNIHSQYNASSSASFQDLSRMLTIQFGTGSLTGRLGHENINMGGVILEDQPFGQILSTVGEVFSLPFDGICGLSYRMTDSVEACFLDGIKKSERLNEKAFTFYFGKNESSLILGAPDKSIRGDDVEWYEVSNKYYWEAKLKDVKIGGTSLLNNTFQDSFSAVFDTGTSVMTMPTAQATMAMTLLRDMGLSCQMIRDGKAPEICYEFEGESKKSICVHNWYENAEGVDESSLSSCAPALMTLDLARENVLILGQPYVTKQ
mmetsp:Transcript_11411/g.18280  ORF Transcript_11411/g.18280 Transcript_11411/m.18280 type:complete len:274 (-) Transcript_11411:393-1214(-)